MPVSALQHALPWLFSGAGTARATGLGEEGSARPRARTAEADSEPLPLLLSDLAPGYRQTQLTLLLAAALLVGFLVTLPARHTQWPVLAAYIPIVDTVLLLGDLLTATLLYAHFVVTRSRALLALATGYCFTGLIIIPHALTFPGAFAPEGLLGAGVNSTIWLYYFWHTGLPLAVIAYEFLRERYPDPVRAEAVQGAIWASIACSAALTVALTALAIAGHAWLPPMMHDAVHWSPAQLSHIAVPLLALLVLAILLLARGRKSVLDIWLMLMLWAWLIELVMVMFTSSRYSVLWYVGRTYGLLSGIIVLLMLLSETTKLYARLAVSIVARRHERETRLMTMDAVAGSIAHEVNQPLAAIVSNANAGQRWLARDPPDIARVSGILDAIARDGHRASDVVAGVRAMFGKNLADKQLSNINDIAKDAVTLVSSELERHGITVRMWLAKGLPLVACDRVQMRQVFLNILTNAIEALDRAPEHRRILTVHTALSEDQEVLVRIKDSGLGLAADELERIFEPFFTTKATGTGLGLPICRSIVESHGGRLWATRRAPHGSIFQFALPGQD